MSRPSDDAPPCYAMVLPGLEPVAADEITRDLGGGVRKTARGLVVFRPKAVDRDLLRLRTTEDVFLYAWGTDELTHRAIDLKNIRRWTEKEVDWDRLIALHHSVTPKPKGKPTYRLVTQMAGKSVYRRVDAGEAMAKGLAGKFPASWKPADEDAAIEFWLTIVGETAVCGVRLSDKTMRHRTYKTEHVPASLRPTVAAAMVRLAGVAPESVTLDPMCGAGTILGEALDYRRRFGFARRADDDAAQVPMVLGGDLDKAAVRAAHDNVNRLGPHLVARWDARRLPLRSESVDRIVSNPPFGKQLASPEEVGPLYARMVPEYDRVLRPGGRAVLLASEAEALRDAVRPRGWVAEKQLRVFVLGQPAALGVWRKPGG